jgi:hypothetical protein
LFHLPDADAAATTMTLSGAACQFGAARDDRFDGAWFVRRDQLAPT